jgi:hypothetical protein
VQHPGPHQAPRREWPCHVSPRRSSKSTSWCQIHVQEKSVGPSVAIASACLSKGAQAARTSSSLLPRAHPSAPCPHLVPHHRRPALHRGTGCSWGGILLDHLRRCLRHGGGVRGSTPGQRSRWHRGGNHSQRVGQLALASAPVLRFCRARWLPQVPPPTSRRPLPWLQHPWPSSPAAAAATATDTSIIIMSRNIWQYDSDVVGRAKLKSSDGGGVAITTITASGESRTPGRTRIRWWHLCPQIIKEAEHPPIHPWRWCCGLCPLPWRWHSWLPARRRTSASFAESSGLQPTSLAMWDGGVESIGANNKRSWRTSYSRGSAGHRSPPSRQSCRASAPWEPTPMTASGMGSNTRRIGVAARRSCRLPGGRHAARPVHGRRVLRGGHDTATGVGACAREKNSARRERWRVHNK